MASKKVAETAERIKALEIQGATAIAVAAISALTEFSKEFSGNEKEFVNQFIENSNALISARPTEPMLRNSIRFVLSALKKNIDQGIKVMQRVVEESGRQFIDYASTSQQKIAKIGSKRIQDKSVVFTHCHSSTVIGILKQAFADGKKFEVICTETRPKLQGRMTAAELAEAGIPVTLIVDSAMRVFVRKADIVLVGSDAVAANGAVVNKIGSSLLALAAKEMRKPFMVASETYKFDPETALGSLEEIEQRPAGEISEDIPGVQIKNPAFDITPPDYIDCIITEEGVISPHGAYEIIKKKFPYIFERID